MTKPIIKVVNSQTGEEIEREMTDEEYSFYETMELKAIKLTENQNSKATARQALLDKLGITEDEAKLLLGGN